jgi:rhodanese-related sulfurtransferase
MFDFIKKLFTGNKVDYIGLLKQGAIIVDVRTPGEFSAGHIEGSKNYPLESVRNKAAELKKLNKPIITVCRSGTRSSIAKGVLKNAGVEVYNGGAWTSLKNKIA